MIVQNIRKSFAKNSISKLIGSTSITSKQVNQPPPPPDYGRYYDSRFTIPLFRRIVIRSSHWILLSRVNTWHMSETGSILTSDLNNAKSILVSNPSPQKRLDSQ